MSNLPPPNIPPYLFNKYKQYIPEMYFNLMRELRERKIERACLQAKKEELEYNLFQKNAQLEGRRYREHHFGHWHPFGTGPTNNDYGGGVFYGGDFLDQTSVFYQNEQMERYTSSFFDDYKPSFVGYTENGGAGGFATAEKEGYSAVPGTDFNDGTTVYNPQRASMQMDYGHSPIRNQRKRPSSFLDDHSSSPDSKRGLGSSHVKPSTCSNNVVEIIDLTDDKAKGEENGKQQ